MTHHCPDCGDQRPHPGPGSEYGAVCPSSPAAIDVPAIQWEELDRVVARQRVRPPGVALIVVGGMWALAGLAFLALALVLLPHTRGPVGIGRGRAVLAVAAVIVPSLVAIGAVIARGGHHLLHLWSQHRAEGGAFTAIVFGVAGSVPLFFGSAMIVVTFPLATGLPVGIWALVVINDPNVKAAFAVPEEP